MAENETLTMSFLALRLIILAIQSACTMINNSILGYLDISFVFLGIDLYRSCHRTSMHHMCISLSWVTCKFQLLAISEG